jgi:hypothetical protein
MKMSIKQEDTTIMTIFAPASKHLIYKANINTDKGKADSNTATRGLIPHSL